MGCCSAKLKKNGPDEIYCLFHKKKLLAESLCLVSECSTCSKEKFALCSSCTTLHHKIFSGTPDLIYVQPLHLFNLSKIAYYKFQADGSDAPLLQNLQLLEQLIIQKDKCQIKITDFLTKIYIPFQELIKFSIKLQEKEKSQDYEMLNDVGIQIGSINGDGRVLDETSSIKHYFRDDNTIRNPKMIVKGYFYDTGLITDDLNQRIGTVKLNENGALVEDHREICVGKISNEGDVKDQFEKRLGNCKANKIKVAYEYFFCNI